jgi:hypothetical protein
MREEPCLDGVNVGKRSVLDVNLAFNDEGVKRRLILLSPRGGFWLGGTGHWSGAGVDLCFCCCYCCCFGFSRSLFLLFLLALLSVLECSFFARSRLHVINSISSIRIFYTYKLLARSCQKFVFDRILPNTYFWHISQLSLGICKLM